MVRFLNPLASSTFRKVFFWIRLVCLFLLVAAALQLVSWSHQYDPRFYQFLGTAPGKALSSIMEWPNLYNRVNAEVEVEDFSDEEKLWHTRIQNRLLQSWPTHTLFLKDGTVRHVRILRNEDGKLWVREHFGHQGRLETSLSLSDIRETQAYSEPLPPVSLRDILFQMEYPEFDLTYFGHYTVLTDAPYYQVADSVEVLETLHQQYIETFSSIIRFPQEQKNLQVLFFSNEEDYREHQRETAPDLKSSVGYYSPLEDRMVVYNQQYSERAMKVRKEVEQDIAELLKRAENPAQRREILSIQQNVEQQIRDRARQETVSTLRHEAAHHLSYTYGVHSWIHTENGWLIEGLASYFESTLSLNMNLELVDSLQRLKRQNRIPPLSKLMDVRQPLHFEQELPGIKSHEAYALSWSLFYFCMLPENRDGFFTYIRNLQNPKDIGWLMATPRIEILSVSLGLRPDELEEKWRQHLDQMLAETWG